MEIFDVLIERKLTENLKVVAYDEEEVLEFLEDYLEDDEYEDVGFNSRFEKNIDVTISRINEIENKREEEKEAEMREFCKKYFKL